MSTEERIENFDDGEVIHEPFTMEDEDRVVKNALARMANDRRFQLTPGQEETIRKAAEREREGL